MHMVFLSRGFKNLQWYSMTKRNTTHSGGVSFWSAFDLRCKSPACGGSYRKAEGNPQRFPPQTPPSSRRTKDSAFIRRKELAADTHARSAIGSEVRQGFCVERISSIPRAWIETSPSKWMGAFASTAKGVNIVKQEELNGFPWNLLPLRPACDGLSDG